MQHFQHLVSQIHIPKYNPKYNIIQPTYKIQCKYCTKVFAFSQSKYRHQKKCKYNTDVNYISKEDYLKELQKIKEKQAEELHQ